MQTARRGKSCGAANATRVDGELEFHERQGTLVTILSRFVVANDNMEAEVRQAFVNRPRRVEHAPGFLRLEVLSPADDPKEFWLLTYWETEQHFRDWHKHHLHDSHQMIPKGLRLDARGTKVQVLHHIAS
jgi:heme-degrading monooxygenase HmoA